MTTAPYESDTDEDGELSLQAWSDGLMRRPTITELTELCRGIRDAVATLQTRDAAPVDFTPAAISVADKTQLSRLRIAQIAPRDPRSLAADETHRVAGLFYWLVTGRPQPAPGSWPRVGTEASVVASGDYPDELLALIDRGLAGADPAISLTDWLAAFQASGKITAHVIDAPIETAPAAKSAARAEAVRQTTGRPSTRARSAVKRPWLLVASGLGMFLAAYALTRQALPPQAPRKEMATPQSAGIARPAPASQATVPTAIGRDTSPSIIERVAAAADRDTLLRLEAEGAASALIARRFADIGFVAVNTSAGSQWLKPGGGETFSDCPGCPQMVVVPPGEVALHLEIATATGNKVVRDARVAVTSAFAAGRFEITRGEFARFVADTGRAMTGGCHRRRQAWELDQTLSWSDPGYPQDDAHPVACVSWDDAVAYVGWLSQQTGRRYRLLGDAEWHYLATEQGPAPAPGSANADTACLDGNGADAAAQTKYPSWNAEPCNDGHVHTAPAGKFRATPSGLHDLKGNVWEWVDGCPPTDADGLAAYPDNACGPASPRIMRGGSFSTPLHTTPVDERIVAPPSTRDQLAGFRVARNL